MTRGTVVREFDPHWRVVDPGGTQRGRFVVVDVSTEKPQQVHGPTTRTDAEAWCRVSVGLWAATMGQGEWT